MIVGSFIIFFLGGYFIYSSMFAAIGSAMGDDYGEGQALVLPVTIPIILAFYTWWPSWRIRNPDSGLMVFASMFPLVLAHCHAVPNGVQPAGVAGCPFADPGGRAAFFFVWMAGGFTAWVFCCMAKRCRLRRSGSGCFISNAVCQTA
jgi:ABC-type Na+ efflux pump permease subunit